MAAIKTSTGTLQEVATENGPMNTTAGSRQYGLVDEFAPGAEPIPDADTYFYLHGNGMQEVTPSAAVPWVLQTGFWDDGGYWLVAREW